MRRFAVLLWVVVWVGVGAAAAEAEKDAELVQSDLRTLLAAMYGGDVDTVLRYTHPAVIAVTGGEEQARKSIQEAGAKIRELGMQHESVTFPRPPDFLEGGGRRFAVVPTLSIVSANGQRIESLNYQLGVLEPDAKGWTYIEGSRIDKENVQSLFPGFPADYEFPPSYRKKL
jgi:hypothetical protein